MRKGDQTRRDILETAARCFGEKGYFQTSIDDIAKELHIAKGTLYQYFHSKQELFDVLIGDALEHVLDRYEVVGQEVETLQDLVTGILYETGYFLVEHYDFLSMALSVGSLQRLLKHRDNAFPYKQMMEKFVVLLEPYRQEMRMGFPRADLILTMYCNACRVMVSEGYMGERPYPREKIRELAREFADSYIHGIGVP